jgi:hypothetical protein
MKKSVNFFFTKFRFEISNVFFKFLSSFNPGPIQKQLKFGTTRYFLFKIKSKVLFKKTSRKSLNKKIMQVIKTAKIAISAYLIVNSIVFARNRAGH